MSSKSRDCLATLLESRRRLTELKPRAEKRLARSDEVAKLVAQVREELQRILPPDSDAFRVYDRLKRKSFWRLPSRDGHAGEVDRQQLDYWIELIDKVSETLTDDSVLPSIKKREDHALPVVNNVGQTPLGAVRVLISYSHDSVEQDNRVLDLSDRLRRGGVDCEVDQYEQFPEEGWPQWMRRQIRDAAFVLVVCTKKYCERFEGRAPEGEGKGAKWEGAIVTRALYESEGKNSKFVPVLFSEEDVQHIPDVLGGATRFVVGIQHGYEQLYRLLTSQPAVTKPALGQVRPLPPRERREDFRAESRPGGQPPARGRREVDSLKNELGPSAVTELLSRLHSGVEPLSKSMADALAIAREMRCPTLEHFCRCELLGWDQKQLSDVFGPDSRYRVVDGFLSSARMNPEYAAAGVDIEQVLASMNGNPHFAPLAFRAAAPLSTLESQQHPKQHESMAILEYSPDMRVYTRASNYFGILGSIRTELTRRLIALLPASAEQADSEGI